MTPGNKRALIAALLALFAMFVIPPWKRGVDTARGRASAPAEYRFIFDPPQAFDRYEYVGIDFSRLILQIGAVVALAGVFFLRR